MQYFDTDFNYFGILEGEMKYSFAKICGLGFIFEVEVFGESDKIEETFVRKIMQFKILAEVY